MTLSNGAIERLGECGYHPGGSPDSLQCPSSGRRARRSCPSGGAPSVIASAGMDLDFELGEEIMKQLDLFLILTLAFGMTACGGGGGGDGGGEKTETATSEKSENSDDDEDSKKKGDANEEKRDSENEKKNDKDDEN